MRRPPGQGLGMRCRPHRRWARSAEGAPGSGGWRAVHRGWRWTQAAGRRLWWWRLPTGPGAVGARSSARCSPGRCGPGVGRLLRPPVWPLHRPNPAAVVAPTGGPRAPRPRVGVHPGAAAPAATTGAPPAPRCPGPAVPASAALRVGGGPVSCAGCGGGAVAVKPLQPARRGLRLAPSGCAQRRSAWVAGEPGQAHRHPPGARARGAAGPRGVGATGWAGADRHGAHEPDRTGAKPPLQGAFGPDARAHGADRGQKDGKRGTVAALLSPAFAKNHRLPGRRKT